ncbi:putative PilV-like protein [Candidatus Glomeribacter gigasporarum BEG34]|uniref:Putative PilV-like protein n=1 Tax=Candidatus Glomeribacter gigasporarum BEG34 TaxID=1070319 RepID=G2J842_9BURK|nr:shufflon system plasmid conjugative transfer pilus tip adhesin PilV [Candidatus Glomeribacter gigasporarum]CCD28939.1 putative PilV-like protein [Candidatus Glomeribacter gigasporarum BEG34]
MLIEIAIVTAIAMMMAGAQLWKQRQQVLADVRSAQGTVLRRIGEGVNQYIVNHYSALIGDTPIPGVAEIYAPTIAELQATGDLDQGFQPVSLLNGLPYVVALSRTPAGCTPPACDISGLVYIRGAITDPSTGAPQPLGDALASLGGDGAYSDTLTPDRLSGPNDAWATRNPLGNVASVLAMRVGYGTSGFSQFVRRDGALPMEGDLNFQGTDGARHNITHVQAVNANTVTTEGDIRVGDTVYAGRVISSGRISAHGGLYSGHTIYSTGDIMTDGWLRTRSDGGWYNEKWRDGWMMSDWDWVRTVNGAGISTARGPIHAGGNISTEGYLQIKSRRAARGTSCESDGLIGRSYPNGKNLLVCQDGQWQSPGFTFTGWQSVNRMGSSAHSGLLVATSCFNCSLVGYTYGPPLVQRFAISQRDKYGQGRVSGTMPVMRGEFWQIDGAEQVWLMSFDD